MLYPSDINYRPFSDEQVERFAECAKREYANDAAWREDLDEAARDLIIGYFSQQWSSPSAITKALKTIANNPDSFLKRLDRKGAEAMSDSVATALRHGTGWTDAQLLDATNHRDKFIAGVESELAFLGRVEERRQEMLKEVGRKRWSNPDVAMTNFVNHLAFVYQDAFLQEATVGLSNNCATFDGPFIRFAKAILDALKENLSEVVRATPLVALLNRMVSGNSALWNRFIRSDYHQLVNGEGWFPDLTDEIKKP